MRRRATTEVFTENTTENSFYRKGRTQSSSVPHSQEMASSQLKLPFPLWKRAVDAFLSTKNKFETNLNTISLIIGQRINGFSILILNYKI